MTEESTSAVDVTSPEAGEVVYQQADVLTTVTSIAITGPDGSPLMVQCPAGVAIISQTCDVVLPNRDLIQLAKLVQLPESTAKEAIDGKRPRYVHLPAYGSNWFADLDHISTAPKALLATTVPQRGVATDNEIRGFGRAVARKFGRFAFPDEVTPWLSPLEKVLSSRSRKESSPEGRALNNIAEIRVEAVGGWGAPPYDLVLVFITEVGALPVLEDDDVPEIPTELGTWLYDGDREVCRTAADVANRLAVTASPVEQYWLWGALGEAWAAKCQPQAGVPDEVRRAVRSVTAEVVAADEYPLSRVRRSEQLDLDHLSPPTPR